MPVRIARGERVAIERGGDIRVAEWPNVKGAAARKVGSGQDPDVSQAGSLVAFEANTSMAGERQFVVTDAATGKVVLRRPGTRPKLSPAGKYVAFSQFVNRDWRAFVAEVAPGAKPRPLSSDPTGPAMVNGWVNEATITAHSNTFARAASVFAVAPDGKVIKRAGFDAIAPDGDLSIPLNAVWADDLRWLVYEANTGEEDASGEGPATGLFLYDTATKKRRRLSPKGYSAGRPHKYGPGPVVTFTAWRNVRNIVAEVWAMDVTTGERTVLMTGAEEAAFAYRGE
jgi:hypothetical protein